MQAAAWLPKSLPWIPPDHDESVVNAVRAFKAGIANAYQQQVAWRYLMYVTRATDEFQDLSFRPGGEEGRRASDFAEGSRFVGMMFNKLLRPEFTPKPPPVIQPTIQKRMRQRRAQKVVAS